MYLRKDNKINCSLTSTGDNERQECIHSSTEHNDNHNWLVPPKINRKYLGTDSEVVLASITHKHIYQREI